MSPSRFFITDNLKVEPVDDGRVAVTVTLPPELVTDYCRFLETLSSFFRVVNRKALFASLDTRTSSEEFSAEAERAISDYRSRIVAYFDSYIESGLNRKDSVKRVAADLRAESHPWCAVHVVQSELVAAGRGGKPGRPPGRSAAGGSP